MYPRPIIATHPPNIPSTTIKNSPPDPASSSLVSPTPSKLALTSYIANISRDAPWSPYSKALLDIANFVEKTRTETAKALLILTNDILTAETEWSTAIETLNGILAPNPEAYLVYADVAILCTKITDAKTKRDTAIKALRIHHDNSEAQTVSDNETLLALYGRLNRSLGEEEEDLEGEFENAMVIDQEAEDVKN